MFRLDNSADAHPPVNLCAGRLGEEKRYVGCVVFISLFMRRLAITAREFVRHVVFATGAYSTVTYLRERIGAGSSAHLHEADVRSRFRAIYYTGVWRHSNDATPRSGLGSSLSATTMIREILPTLLDDLNAQTLLDVGCGDFFGCNT